MCEDGGSQEKIQEFSLSTICVYGDLCIRGFVHMRVCVYVYLGVCLFVHMCIDPIPSLVAESDIRLARSRKCV